MTLQQTYLNENGFLKIPHTVYEEMNFSLDNDTLFLSEKDNCVIISKSYENLPVCNVFPYSDCIEIDHEYCSLRGLFNPKTECMRENTVYKTNQNNKTMRCILLTSEYKLQYYIKNNTLIIPLSQEQAQNKYHYCIAIENGKIHLPPFILSTLGIKQNTVLKAEVKDGAIHCRKCQKTDSITYHQTITPDSADIKFKEQFLTANDEEIELENFLLKTAQIPHNSIVTLTLKKKTEFVIEKLR